MKGSLHTDELMRAVTSEQDRPAHGAADQPRLHHGRADLCGDAVHHRCRHQHLPRSRCQARHRPERDRSVHAGRAGHAARRDPVGGRDGDAEDPLDHRGGGALQDGRPRPDHRRHARRPAGLRQCHRSRGGEDQGHQVARSRAARRSWSCPISRPATCWPRISPSWPRPMRRASFSARACRSSSPRARIRCARAWPPARSAVLYADARRAHGARCRRPERHGHDPRRQCRFLERQVPGVRASTQRRARARRSKVRWMASARGRDLRAKRPDRREH